MQSNNVSLSPPRFNKSVEGLSQKAAQKQADKVREYWFDQGYKVETWTEHITTRMKGKVRTFYVVRSDMVNGKPARKVG